MKTLVDREDLVFNPPELGSVLYLSGLPGGGSKVYDRSPYGNHGTIVGATWVRLPSGLWCLSYDGNDDYVEISDHSSLNISGALTLKVWVKLNAYVPWAGAVSKRIGDNDNYNILFYANGKKPYFQVTVGSVAKQAPYGSELVLGTWAHLVGTFDGTKIRFYINKEQEGDGTDTGGNLDIAAANVILGRYSTAALNGLIALPKLIRGTWNALDIQNSFNREKHLFGVW